MLTYYCPNCWETIEKKQGKCPHCGYALENYSILGFEEKLLAALHHTVPERRNMAAQILGNIHSVRALSEFIKIIEAGEQDYFTLRAIIMAAAKIHHPKRLAILKKLSKHDSSLVSKMSKEVLEKVEKGEEIVDWDRYTG